MGGGEVQTQVLTLAQQELYLVSHLPSHKKDILRMEPRLPVYNLPQVSLIPIQ